MAMLVGANLCIRPALPRIDTQCGQTRPLCSYAIDHRCLRRPYAACVHTRCAELRLDGIISWHGQRVPHIRARRSRQATKMCEVSMRYAILLHQRADGKYHASVPLMPELSRVGETREDILQAVQQALIATLATAEVVYLDLPAPAQKLDNPWLATAG